jgi:hypothetical protein
VFLKMNVLITSTMSVSIIPNPHPQAPQVGGIPMDNIATSEALDACQRIAVLIHWIMGLGAVPGTTLDGLEMAARAASHDGHLQLAPAWVQAWVKAGRPLHGIQTPPPPIDKAAPNQRTEEDSPEVKELCALMDPLEVSLREKGHITDEEGDLMIECWWALHDFDHEKAIAFLAIQDRLSKDLRTSKKSVKPQS